MNKQDVKMYTTEYYSAIKRSEALTHVTIKLNLKNIALSERNQTHKATRCMIPLIPGKSKETGNRLVVVRGCGNERRSD